MHQPRQLLPGGNQGHRAGVGYRTLSVGVKRPDCVHLVVPHFYPERQDCVGRKDVDDPAPVAERTRRFHQRLVPVAQFHPTIQHLAKADSLLQGHAGGGQGVAGRHRAWVQTGVENGRRQGQPERGSHRGDYQRRRLSRAGLSVRGAGQSGQGGQPLVAGMGVYGQPFKGKHLGFRQQVGRGVLSQVGLKVVVETPGVFRPGRQHQNRGSQSAPEGPDVGRSSPLANGNGRGILEAGEGCHVAAESRMRADHRQNSG